MAELDPLSISSGPNRGEAAFLGESSFDPIQTSYRLANELRARRKEKQAQQQADIALLDDKIKTQWDADTINYFSPRIQALKEDIIKTFQDQKGEITPIQRMQFKNAWDELRNEADVNNANWTDYRDQVRLLDRDTEGKYDREASVQLMNLWRNPYSDPAAKAEIENTYGGNINKWRAANAEKFRLIPSFSMDKYIGDVTKDEKAQTFAVRDEKGNVVYGKHPTGERYFQEETKLTPQSLNTVNNRIWGENNYQANQAKQRARSQVDKLFTINDAGLVGYDSGMTEAEKLDAKYIIEQAGDLRGLKPEEIKERLAKGYTALQIDRKTNQGRKLRDIGFAPQPSGGGKSFADKYTVTNSPYQTGGGAAEFNRKYPDANMQASDQRRGTHQGKNVRIVAIEPNKASADTESIQLMINGKQVRPINYIVDDDTGEIFGIFSQNTPVTDDMGNAKYQYQTVEIPLDDKVITNVAARYGFGGNDGVAKFKEQALGLTPEKSRKKRGNAKNYGL